MDERQHCPLCATEYGPEVPFCPADMSDLARGPAPSATETETMAGTLTEAGRAAAPAVPPAPVPPAASPARTSLDAPAPSNRVALVIDGARVAVQDGQRVVLGRDPALPTSAVFAAHDNVSRLHCSVELRGGHLSVTDLASSNGTFVDDVRLAAEVPTVLAPGSTLRLARDVPVQVVR